MAMGLKFEAKVQKQKERQEAKRSFRWGARESAWGRASQEHILKILVGISCGQGTLTAGYGTL